MTNETLQATTLRLHHQLQQLRERINQTARTHGRDADCITLLAVSKTRTAQELRCAWQAGATAFGENYLNEAQAKQEALSDLAIQWHFIGPIQSNKTRSIATSFDWVHSVDRLKIAKRLAEQRGPKAAAMKVLIQINIDEEASKAGVFAADAQALADDIAQLPNLTLCGLMAIPGAGKSRAQQHATFASMARLRDALQAHHPHCTELSMGMSDDFEAAIAEGATIIRLGTALFGPRP